MVFKPFNQKTVQNLLINLKPGDSKKVLELQDYLRALPRVLNTPKTLWDPLAELHMFGKPGTIS